MSVPDTSIDPRLLESAKQEFQKHGFLKAELKNICKGAGITTGAVYKRYKGKEELFCAVVDETVAALEEFIVTRSDIDFSVMSDEEIVSSWTMTYNSMMPLFEMLIRHRDSFVLLISKAAGTKYENFSHEYVTKMSYSYEEFYKEARRRGMAEAKVTREEFHILLSSFWTCICEPFVHELSNKKIEEHCRVMCRFFDWSSAISIK